MEIMKIGGILLLAALALWIIKSLFDWWGEPLMVEETCEPGGPADDRGYRGCRRRSA